jgi:perosamine synthetase
MKIPWFKPYFDEQERNALISVFDSGWMSQGERVAQLERRCEELTGAAGCVAISNGTAALDVALKLLNVGVGDEVIVPAFAYIATPNSVMFQSATPVFADVDPVTYNLDPAAVEKKISPRTKAIIAIDYAGQAAPWRELRQLAESAGIGVIEDAAPSLGGSYGGQALCTLGDISITSFHVAKTFTSIEGGMLFLRSEEDVKTAKMLRSHGESPTEKYVHPILGHNFRMSDLHACIGLAQLNRFEKVLAGRAEMAKNYNEFLAQVDGVTTPTVLPGNVHSWFLYPILVDDRDVVRQRMADAGVGTNVSWPLPAYRQKHLSPSFSEECPVTESLCKRVLCLPMFYELTRNEQQIVAETLAESLVTKASSKSFAPVG